MGYIDEVKSLEQLRWNRMILHSVDLGRQNSFTLVSASYNSQLALLSGG